MSDLLKFLSGLLGNLAEAALILIAGLIFIKIASSIMRGLYRGVISMRRCIN